MGNTLTVWQPLYFPRLHYLARLARSDQFVIFDDAEFSRGSPQHRARIDYQSNCWLTIPIKRESDNINISEARIDMNQDWIRKHLGTLQAKYGGNSIEMFQSFYNDLDDTASLVDITIPLLKKVLSVFKIDVETHLSSETDVPYQKGDPSTYNARLCEHFGADTYYCGENAYNSYLDDLEFTQRDIEIRIQKWEPSWQKGNVICLDPLFETENHTEVVK